MASSTRQLLEQVEAYCRRAGIAESTFGRQAVNDGKLCSRLRAGKNITLETAQRLQDYMSQNAAGDETSSPANAIVNPAETVSGSPPMKHQTDDRPFRFYDNRQKYLAFVNTCNEKWKVAERATQELTHLRPSPPALRLFDAGVGDSTVLSHLMRAMHRRFPTIPFFIVGKEVSLEDVRLTLEKLPDRFIEHPASVIVVTNLYYAEAPWLMPNDVAKAAALNWMEVPLQGDSAHQFGEQLRGLDKELVDGWQVKASEKSGNPMYVRPSVMVLFREDHRFLLDDVIPRRGQAAGGDYDLVLASQPWRARMSAEFKVKHVLAPLVKSLRPGGRLLTAQSCGDDPGLELVRKIWPEEDPFQVDRHLLIKTLKEFLGHSAQHYNFNASSDAKSIIRYYMHTLPTEISEAIGTSTLFAAWNAAIYVGQIEDERLEPVISSGEYLDATAEVLHKHNGIWFNDETFVVSRNAISEFFAGMGRAISLILAALLFAGYISPVFADTVSKRVPAEWEPQQAVWLQWPGPYERMYQPAFARLSSIISRYQPLHILYHSKTELAQARKAISSAGGDPDHVNIDWQQVANDSAWMRDNGPVYVVENEQMIIQDWGFDAWGGAFGSDIPYANDDRVPAAVGKRLGMPVQTVDIVHERGNLEFNGVDTVLLNWSTLGDPARNPGYTRAQAKRDLRQHFGVTRVVMVEGVPEGDLTRGHIDGFARFINADTVVVAQCTESSACRSGDGSSGDVYDRAAATIAAAGFKVIRDPILAQVRYRDASFDTNYLNWLVGNGYVITVGFGDAAADRAAKQRIEQYFPGRDVFVVEMLASWYYGGGVHCHTNDQPAL